MVVKFSGLSVKKGQQAMEQRNHRLTIAVRLLIEHMLEHREQLKTLMQQESKESIQTMAFEGEHEGVNDGHNPLPSPVGSG